MLIIGCDYHPSFQQIAFVDPRMSRNLLREASRQGEFTWLA